MRVFAALAAIVFASTLWAEEEKTIVDLWNEDRSTVFTAEDGDLDSLRWIARPIIVFGDGPADPQFQLQMELLLAEAEELAERDVIIFADTDPESALRERFRPRSFMVALVGKDGQIKLRKPNPWNVREFSRSIDKMPMRQQEIRDRRVGSE